MQIHLHCMCMQFYNVIFAMLNLSDLLKTEGIQEVVYEMR